jgi:HPt (histidine-containing phosphotransfer) domain-containing protein
MTTAGDVLTNGSAASGQQDAVDWDVLDGYAVLRKPGAPDLRRRLMTIYLNSSPMLMEGIKTAFRASDAPSMMTAAHTLKSSSLNVGAMELGSLCAELVRIAREDALQEAGDLLRRAEAQYTAVTEAFKDALRQSEKGLKG